MKLRPTPRRRLLIIIGVMLLVIACAALYVWASVNAWSTYQTRLMSEKSAYESLQKQALTGDSIVERQAAIRRIDDKLAQRDGLCHIHPAFTWQAKIIPALKDGAKKCESKQSQLNAIAGPVHALRTYVDTAESVRAAIMNIATDQPLTEKNWMDKGVEASKNAIAAIKQVRADDDQARALKKRALALSESLENTWERLLAAHKKKDKAGFMTASTGVTDAYAAVMELADMTDQVITERVEALSEAFAAPK